MDPGSHYVASPTGVDVALPVAGTGSRSYAFLVDWHIRVILALAWFLVAALIMTGSIRNLAAPGSARALGLATLPASAIYLLYHPLLEILMRGRTPGKRMAGVRIVTRDGGVPSVGALLVRNVFRLIDMLPALYMVGIATSMMSRERTRLGDMVAGTLLVHDGSPAADALAALAGVAGGARLDPAVVDVAQSLLRRWDELAPARRETLAHKVLMQLGAPPYVPDGSHDDYEEAPGLRAALVRALQGENG
jgi:uncharacterized RDD family membrane protein YckC